jgi:hypothetical protein
MGVSGFSLKVYSINSVAVRYNAARDEIYVTHRNDRSPSV